MNLVAASRRRVSPPTVSTEKEVPSWRFSAAPILWGARESSSVPACGRMRQHQRSADEAHHCAPGAGTWKPNLEVLLVACALVGPHQRQPCRQRPCQCRPGRQLVPGDTDQEATGNLNGCGMTWGRLTHAVGSSARRRCRSYGDDRQSFLRRRGAVIQEFATRMKKAEIQEPRTAMNSERRRGLRA